MTLDELKAAMAGAMVEQLEGEMAKMKLLGYAEGLAEAAELALEHGDRDLAAELHKRCKASLP